jgi:hypothetical protein
MGVTDLWAFLRSVGAMHEWNADSEGTTGVQKACAAQVEGRVVAVDISKWAFNALMQQALVAVYEREEARVLMLAFDRVRCPHAALLSSLPHALCTYTLPRRMPWTSFHKHGVFQGRACGPQQRGAAGRHMHAHIVSVTTQAKVRDVPERRSLS